MKAISWRLVRIIQRHQAHSVLSLESTCVVQKGNVKLYIATMHGDIKEKWLLIYFSGVIADAIPENTVRPRLIGFHFTKKLTVIWC